MRALDNLSIKTKVMAIFGLMLLVTCSLGYLAIIALAVTILRWEQ